MEPSYSLNILDLNGVVRTVDNIMWNTTASELLRRLLPHLSSLSGISIVEIWHECVKRVPMTRTLSSVIREWGYTHISSDDVRLAILRNPKWRYDHAYMWKRRKHVRVRPKVTHKRKYQIKQSKVSMANAISKVTQRITEEKKKLDELLDPASATDTASALIHQLPEKKEHSKALVEAIDNEKKENQELLLRKKELSEKISSKEKAVEKTKKKISDLNAQVLNEQYKLQNLKESRNGFEIEQIKKEISHVENEISVRVKLNKLQLSKMNDLTEKVLQAEEDLKYCDRELEKLQVV